jgi:hypothetical protein
MDRDIGSNIKKVKKNGTRANTRRLSMSGKAVRKAWILKKAEINQSYMCG